MRIEHDEIDKSLKNLITIKDLEMAQENFLELISLVRDHFDKEEKILFPLAKTALKPAKLIDLGTQWAEHNNIPLNMDNHEIT